MADPASSTDGNAPASEPLTEPPAPPLPRHTLTVRITHWVAALSALALLVTGIELVISHPRFYWGEEGNVNTSTLFSLPIPSSRGSVPTGYSYVLPDQNGWSRALHFQTAWVVVPTGLWYLLSSLLSGHLLKDLLPSRAGLSPKALFRTALDHLLFRPVRREPAYNPLQRISYLVVVFVAFPFMIWTGLAMSPSATSLLPFLATALGGHQSARTLHFLDTIFLVLFVAAHVVMVFRTGFRRQLAGMIGGGSKEEG
ncbi:MAG TPA: hypothetical protein DCM86_16800 [Verrucomicrobiales bacterium]|nr:hypothetical protein [Verrucomicrobiales bacterium]